MNRPGTHHLIRMMDIHKFLVIPQQVWYGMRAPRIPGDYAIVRRRAAA
jgi:hypothetical protein